MSTPTRSRILCGDYRHLTDWNKLLVLPVSSYAMRRRLDQ